MQLKDFIKGWIVGDFEPTLYKTNEIEVGVKEYKKGDKEKPHLHKIATEITILIRGKIKMKEVMNEGDIVVLKHEYCGFEALEDSTLLVIKYPSVKGDKYD